MGNGNNNLEGKDTLRVAIVTLLVALNFGILNYFGDAKFSSIDFGLTLKVIANVFVNFNLLVFLFYVLLLGVSKAYRKPKMKEFHTFLYDLGMALTMVIVTISIIFIIGFKISPYLNNNVIFIYSYLILSVLAGAFVFNQIMKPHRDDFMKIWR